MKQNKTFRFWKLLLIVVMALLITQPLATTANAKTAKYTVSFDKNGGKGKMSKQKISVGKKVKLRKNTFKREGYIFMGWSAKKSGKGKLYADQQKVKDLTTADNTIKLYAQWKKGVKITLDANGGYTSKASILSLKGKQYGQFESLPTPTRKGYKFTGWYTAKVGGSLVTAKTKLKSSKPVTLYAHYEVIRYSVSYTLNGGTNATSNPTSYTVNDRYILEAPTRTGYRFVGWYKDSSFRTKVAGIANGTVGNVRFYARWEVIEYDITYELDGGTNSEDNPYYYTVEDSITLAAPSKLGYRFDGWTIDSEEGDTFTQITPGSTGDIKLYAHYTPIVMKEEWAVRIMNTMGCKLLDESEMASDMDGEPVFTFDDMYEVEDWEIDGVSYTADQIKMYIESAAQYGFIPFETNEEGASIFFDPIAPVSREFAAKSSVDALGFLPEYADELICSDADDVTYKEAVSLALHEELLALQDDEFMPETELMLEERDVLFDKMEQINQTTEVSVEDEADQTQFTPVVTVLSDSVTYEITVSANTIESNSEWADIRNKLSADNTFTVSVPNTSETTAIQANSIAEGETNADGYTSDSYIKLPANDIFANGIILNVVETSTASDKVTLTCKLPENPAEIYQTLDTTGTGLIDASRIEGLNGVSAEFVPDDDSKHESETGFGDIDVDNSFAVPGKVNFTFNSVKISKNAALNGKIAVSIPDISYRVKTHFNLFEGGLKIDDLLFSITENADLTGELKWTGSGASIADDGAIEIGRLPIPLGTTGLSVDLVFWLNYSVTGTASVSVKIDATQGIQLVKGKMRVINNANASLEAKAEGKFEAGPKLSAMLTLGEVFDLVDVTGDTGVAITASVTDHRTAADLACIDMGAYLYLRLSAGTNSIIGELLHTNWVWDIYKSDNSPLKKTWHFEQTDFSTVIVDLTKMNLVPACTFKDGTVKGTIKDASDNHKISNATVKVYTESGILKKTVYTDSTGKYTVKLKPGKYRFAITAKGYLAYTDYYTIVANLTTYPEISLLVDKQYVDTDTQARAGGKIIDSVEGKDVTYADIKVRKNWNNTNGPVLLETTTDYNGIYDFSYEPGNYTLEISKSGYVTGYLNIVISGTDNLNQNGELTPEHISGEGILRIVLTWGAEPRDLDSHLLGPTIDGNDRFHVYFSNRNYYANGYDDDYYDDEDYSSDRVVNLDRDDTSSYGPETVTVYQLNDTGTYSYYVYDYTNGGEDYDIELGEISRAKVKVYNQGSLIATFSVPSGEEGDCWHVFDYDAATNTITPVNTMSYVSYSSAVGRETLDPSFINDASSNASELFDLDRIYRSSKEKKE